MPCSEGPCNFAGRIMRWGYWVCSRHDTENVAYYNLHDKMTNVDKTRAAALARGVVITNEKIKADEGAKKSTSKKVLEKVARGLQNRHPSPTDVCHVPGCENDTKALLPSGHFACHDHTRGVKGAKFFTKQPKKGAEIVH